MVLLGSAASEKGCHHGITAPSTLSRLWPLGLRPSSSVSEPGPTRSCRRHRERGPAGPPKTPPPPPARREVLRLLRTEARMLRDPGRLSDKTSKTGRSFRPLAGQPARRDLGTGNTLGHRAVHVYVYAILSAPSHPHVPRSFFWAPSLRQSSRRCRRCAGSPLRKHRRCLRLCRTNTSWPGPRWNASDRETLSSAARSMGLQLCN